MVDMTRALRHLAWADERFYMQFARLPEEAMGARYAPDHWPAGHLAAHMMASAGWYQYCLTGRPGFDTQWVRTPSDLGGMLPQLLEIDAVLLEQASLPDELMTIQEDDGTFTAMRSTILAQACLHATEHRAQVSCALEASGFPGIVLDDLDFWEFEKSQG